MQSALFAYPIYILYENKPVCVCVYRAAGECRPARTHFTEGRLQCPEGQDTASQMGGAAGHSMWHMPDRGLRQRQPDGQDAHPTPGRREGKWGRP